MTAIMVIPFSLTDGNLVSSNVPETDYPAWVVGTTYAQGDRVISTTTHKIYESVSAGNTGNDPTLSANVPTFWLVVGSTNRWRAFDTSLGQSVTNPDTIEYVLTTPQRLDSVAFIGLVGTFVRVIVKDGSSTVRYDITQDLLDVGGITSWLDFFSYDGSYDPEIVLNDIGALSGFRVEITISTVGGTAQVAEIVAGKVESLGTILSGTRSGFTDYSRKEIDDFGNITIVKRPTARRAEWELSFETRANRRIQRALEDARGAPAYFYPGPEMTDFYVSVYGVVDDFFPALEGGGTTQATLSITGAT